MSKGEIRSLVDELVPEIYAHRRAALGATDSSPMAQSVYCHTMTHDLWRALDARKIPVRRELHGLGAFRTPNDGIWHYVVALGSGAPTPEDVLIDLNPDCFTTDGQRFGRHLYDLRVEMEELFRQRGLETAAALHGLGTIIEAHSLKPGGPLSAPSAAA